MHHLSKSAPGNVLGHTPGHVAAASFPEPVVPYKPPLRRDDHLSTATLSPSQSTNSALLEDARQHNLIPIAIVIQGYGYSKTLSESLISRIPAPVAVTISPYVDQIADLIAQSRATHREVYVTLPMRSAHPEQVDAGPQALGDSNSMDDERQRLLWWFNRAKGATGMTDASENGDEQTGSGYVESAEFQTVAQRIAEHGFLYLSSTSAHPRRTTGMTATSWINSDTDAETIDHALHLIGSNTQPGEPVLIILGPVTPVALDRLATWLSSPDFARFRLVPPSALANDPNAAQHAPPH